MSWPLNSVLHALRACIILVLGLQNAARAQHNHPCWSAKRSRLPHKELQAVEGDPKPPIYITKNVENESQELHKSMGIFCLRGVKHGCLEEQNKFHGSIQLQLGTGSHFYVYFAGLNWFAQLHGHPRGSQLHGSLPVNSAASCLSGFASYVKLLADCSNNLGYLAIFSQKFLLLYLGLRLIAELSLRVLSWSLEHR